MQSFRRGPNLQPGRHRVRAHERRSRAAAADLLPGARASSAPTGSCWRAAGAGVVAVVGLVLAVVGVVGLGIPVIAAIVAAGLLPADAPDARAGSGTQASSYAPGSTLAGAAAVGAPGPRPLVRVGAVLVHVPVGAARVPDGAGECVAELAVEARRGLARAPRSCAHASARARAAPRSRAGPRPRRCR